MSWSKTLEKLGLASWALLLVWGGMLHASEPASNGFAARLGAPVVSDSPDQERAAALDPKALEKWMRDFLRAEEERRKKGEDEKQREAKSKFQEVGADLNLKARWRDGLYLETPLKDFTVHVGGRVHQDWVWFDQDASLLADKTFDHLTDGIFFRRARLRVDGTAYEVVDWIAEFEFAVVTDVVPRNVWVQITQLPVVGQFRIGHFREPFGLERMTSGRDITFLERGPMDDAFIPSFSPGAMFWDAPLEERMTWAVGFFRNTAEPDRGIDFGDGEYAWTGRLTGLPWDKQQGRCLVHLGADLSHRVAELDNVLKDKVVRLRGRPRFRDGSFLPGFVDTGLIRADSLDLVGAEAAFVLGPFSMQAEYTWTRVANAIYPAVNGTARGNPVFQGGYVMASYFLTGEHRPYDRRAGAFGRVRPLEPFFFVRTEEGPWSLGRGAWEIAAQVGWLDLHNAGIQGGILKDATLALNWYLNPCLRFQWDLSAAHREVPAPAQSGTVIALGMRLAMEF